MSFAKQTLYFSDLRKEDDPITIKMLSDEPAPGRFKKDQLQHHFECEGKSHFLIIDSDAMGEALSGRKGQVITIRAVGGKGEEDIEIVEEGAPPPRQTRTATQPPAKTSAPAKAPPPPASAEERDLAQRRAYNKMLGFFGGFASAGKMALAASRYAFFEAFKVKEEEQPQFAVDHIEQIRTFASVGLIAFDRGQNFGDLPAKAPEKKAAAPAKKPEPPPEPEPEPEPESDLEPDNIPFS